MRGKRAKKERKALRGEMKTELGFKTKESIVAKLAFKKLFIVIMVFNVFLVIANTVLLLMLTIN